MTDFNSSDDGATAVAIQGNGKIVVAGGSNENGTYDFAVARYTKSGVLDTSFGVGGKVINDLSFADDFAAAMAIQKNGKIVVAGQAGLSNNTVAVVRYTTTGPLDPSFGTGGVALHHIGTGSDDQVYAVALQKDGRSL